MTKGDGDTDSSFFLYSAQSLKKHPIFTVKIAQPSNSYARLSEFIPH